MTCVTTTLGNVTVELDEEPCRRTDRRYKATVRLFIARNGKTYYLAFSEVPEDKVVFSHDRADFTISDLSNLVSCLAFADDMVHDRIDPSQRYTEER